VQASLTILNLTQAAKLAMLGTQFGHLSAFRYLRVEGSLVAFINFDQASMIWVGLDRSVHMCVMYMSVILHVDALHWQSSTEHFHDKACMHGHMHGQIR